MEEQARKKRAGLALCLSGGGFRAALFHLGALRRLDELGILARVGTISTVSGGSILSGFLAHQMVGHQMKNGMNFAHWEEQVARPFREFASRDLRTWPVLAHILWNWAWPDFRIDHLARIYQTRLTSLKLKDLPSRPRFIFCATDLVFGVNWKFTKEKSGDYEAGYCAALADWPLARVVAASSSFPPVFGPMRLRVPSGGLVGGHYRRPNRDTLLGSICLSDGGVYDNMGLELCGKTMSASWCRIAARHFLSITVARPGGGCCGMPT